MRIEALERDQAPMFLQSEAPDSQFLYARMAETTYAALGVRAGARVLDVAAGVGRDALALAGRGVRVVGVEPSRVLTQLVDYLAEREGWPDHRALCTRVRAFGEALPFGSDTFDAAFCKGSLDHFDDPAGCIAEMARVTRGNGRVVLTVANMDSLSLRLARLPRPLRPHPRIDRPGRRHYDAPADHITRYDARLLRSHAERYIHVEQWLGVSILWGVRRWSTHLTSLSETSALAWLRRADGCARAFPSLADVIVVAGRPRRART